MDTDTPLRHEWRTAISDSMAAEAARAGVPFETFLRYHGIDPAQPYRQRHIPEMRCHVFTQRLPQPRQIRLVNDKE